MNRYFDSFVKLDVDFRKNITKLILTDFFAMVFPLVIGLSDLLRRD